MDKNEQIVAAVHAACAMGRVALTHVNNDGVEVPTDVAKCFVAALASQPVSADANNQSERDAWQPIETAPKDGTKYLGVQRGEITIYSWSQRQFKKFGNGFHFNGNGLRTPTHWMPLPTPPIAARADQEKASKAGDHE